MMSAPRPSLAGDAVRLTASLLAAFVAAAIGAVATVSNLDPWYAGLVKPPWTPPNSVFGPVWTLLYTLMGIAAWLVWRRGGSAGANVTVPLGWFVVQLVLNALWSWLFFGWHRAGLAFLEVLLLWVAILATILSFRRVSALAASLLIPYLLWVTYASALNGAIARLN
jgi:tryptophan-rich sensory protein